MRRRKFVIFTEHRDTLSYLLDRLRSLRGRHDAVVAIHGGMHREERKAAEIAFKNDPAVEILVATDAAGEGINLQRAHLMANYDLPWNPNRIEQRFGRIHRIGQTEVCHLWNLVALDTREGEVFRQLFDKIEKQREVLGDGVFDILGMLFRNESLRDLLVEAIRYGESPEVRGRFEEHLDNLLDVDRAKKLMEERALAADTMDLRMVQEVRAEMERAEARRLQPHFIRSFFLEAFRKLGGSRSRQAEHGRFEITHVPLEIRTHAEQMFGCTAAEALRAHCLREDATRRSSAGRVCLPGPSIARHRCRSCAAQIWRERASGRDLNRSRRPGKEPRLLFIFESTVQDARTTRDGRNETVSRELHFVEQRTDGTTRTAGFAPHLDYRPPTDDERSRLRDLRQYRSRQCRRNRPRVCDDDSTSETTRRSRTADKSARRTCTIRCS